MKFFWTCPGFKDRSVITLPYGGTYGLIINEYYKIMALQIATNSIIQNAK